MIADDVLGFGMLYSTSEVHQVVEALIPFGELRTCIVRERSMQEVDHLDSVDHLPLSRAWVDATSRSDDASRGCIEVLILQLALTATVDGEGKVRTEGPYIKVVHALADLFVRGEADADTPVG